MGITPYRKGEKYTKCRNVGRRLITYFHLSDLQYNLRNLHMLQIVNVVIIFHIDDVHYTERNVIYKNVSIILSG